jgi:hypothetical protein
VLSDQSREHSITELGTVMREYMDRAQSETDPDNRRYWRSEAKRVLELMSLQILARSPAAVRRMEIARGLV